jgi:hypothetical protein
MYIPLSLCQIWFLLYIYIERKEKKEHLSKCVNHNIFPFLSFFIFSCWLRKRTDMSHDICTCVSAFSHCVFASFFFLLLLTISSVVNVCPAVPLFFLSFILSTCSIMLDRFHSMCLCVYKLAVVLCVMNYSKQQQQQKEKHFSRVFDPVFFSFFLWAISLTVDTSSPASTIPLRAWTDSGMTRFSYLFISF